MTLYDRENAPTAGAIEQMRSKPDQILVWLIILPGLVIFSILFFRLFTLDSNGLSLVSGRLPYWDFTNLWAGGKLALQGNVDAIFSIEGFRIWLRETFNPHLPHQEWSYPPSLLLLGVPLAFLPIAVAYACWQTLSFLALYGATRFLKLPLAGQVAIVLSPPALMSDLVGQNGLLSAALIISSLSLLPRRPIIAGALIGLLSMKPQLGVLFPFILFSSRSYRAFASAAVTATLLILLTGVLFGFDVWVEFLTKTRPLMTAILDTPYSIVYPVNEVTVFAFMRSIGANLQTAYVVQLLMAAGCVAVCVHVWKPSCRMDPIARVCLTAALAVLATPYDHNYDCVPIAAGLMYVYFHGQNSRSTVVLAAFFSPVFYILSVMLKLCLYPILPLLLSTYFLVEAIRSAREARPDYRATREGRAEGI